MGYGILAEGVILIHLAWIFFVFCGILIALQYPWVCLVHGGALAFSLFLNITGLYCPLTYLENHLAALQNEQAPYEGPFIAHYLAPVVYPRLTEGTIRVGVSLFACLNLVGYGVLFHRRRRGRIGKSAPAKGKTKGR